MMFESGERLRKIVYKIYEVCGELSGQYIANPFEMDLTDGINRLIAVARQYSARLDEVSIELANLARSRTGQNYLSFGDGYASIEKNAQYLADYIDGLLDGKTIKEKYDSLYNSSVTNLRTNALNGVPMNSASFPNVTTIAAGSSSNINLKIDILDFPKLQSIPMYGFYGAWNLRALALRSDSVCTLENINAFDSCTVKTSETSGYIYVPRVLVDSYKTATNWVTYAAKFRALEDYTVDGTTTGALDESKI